MKILLIGSGGREHAIGWKLAADPANSLTSLPGNPGLAELGATIEGIAPTDAGAIATMAASHAFDLVVVGPEAPLAAGVADALDRAGIPVFGPSRAAAKLETSKAFAKQMMDQAGVPTAGWSAHTEPASALARLRETDGPYVVKADGLAAGKGVLVTDNRQDAERWVDDCFGGRFGEAGARIVIEDHLAGPELSVFAVCDGTTAVPLAPARDYKRALDGDEGPNTGGMGSYSPVTDLPGGIVQTTIDEVVTPILEVMRERGTPYRGFLYTGFVLTEDGPQVLEFNCRLGDPETQVVLPRMEGEFTQLLVSAAAGDLAAAPAPRWSGRSAVNVVLASQGYPTEPRSGDIISGPLDSTDDVLVFHAGTTHVDGRLATAGGRVLNVVGLGETLTSAREKAYERVATISWSGMQFRTDIAGAT